MKKIEVPRKYYDERILFRRKGLILKHNSISCFVGCNGTGKTTLINHIIGDLKDSGARKIKDHSMKVYGDSNE